MQVIWKRDKIYFTIEPRLEAPFQDIWIGGYVLEKKVEENERLRPEWEVNIFRYSHQHVLFIGNLRYKKGNPRLHLEALNKNIIDRILHEPSLTIPEDLKKMVFVPMTPAQAIAASEQLKNEASDAVEFGGERHVYFTQSQDYNIQIRIRIK